jgi:hypothetical protein
MKFVQGRGNRRSVLELPSGSIVAKADDKEQRAFLGTVCNILGIK